MHVNAIGDQPGRQAAQIERRTHDTRFAIAELALGVEQMGHHRRPGFGGGLDLRVARFGVADTDDNAGTGEAGDLCRRHGLGRNRNHQVRKLAPRRYQPLQIGVIHGADQRRIVCALAGWPQMRAFEMKPQKSGYAALRGACAGGDHGGGFLARVGDEGRQASRRAIAEVGCADRLDRRGIGCEVQQRAAAPIDLQVDQPRREEAARERYAGDAEGSVSGGDTLDPLAVDDQHRAVPPQLAVEDARAGIGDAAGHIVSVTLLRCGG